jgi:hypothetical protein
VFCCLVLYVFLVAVVWGSGGLFGRDAAKKRGGGLWPAARRLPSAHPLPPPARRSSQPLGAQVLADFHICRSSYQAAAGALLAYARRLVAEGPEDPGQLGEAEAALTAAVSCLRCGV